LQDIHGAANTLSSRISLKGDLQAQYRYRAYDTAQQVCQAMPAIVNKASGTASLAAAQSSQLLLKKNQLKSDT
jgi:hypothetical protein